MGINRRIEYVRWCDCDSCYEGEVNAEWQTRQEAEEQALADGWIRLTYGRWACPQCAAKMRLKKITPDNDALRRSVDCATPPVLRAEERPW